MVNLKSINGFNKINQALCLGSDLDDDEDYEDDGDDDHNDNPDDKEARGPGGGGVDLLGRGFRLLLSLWLVKG